MKKVIRFAGMGALLAAFVAVGSAVGYAQAACEDYDGIAALDTKIRENYVNIKTLPVAVEAGKQYLEKYGSCEFTKDFVDWLKPQLPKWEEDVKKEEIRKVRSAILTKFDAAVPAKNWDAAYEAGTEFMEKFPNDDALINVIIPLGQIGLLESAPPKKNYKYNDQSLRFADRALEMLRAGVKSSKPSGEFGVFQFQANREDTISNLVYSKAYIKYWAQDKKKEGIVDYYAVTQLPGVQKTNPVVYETIGAFYYDEVTKLVDENKKLIAELAALEDLEARKAKDAEIAAKEALLKGYAERAIDAYARAYKTTRTDAASKAYRDNLYTVLKGLYQVRFGQDTGLDAYIATAVEKPMPNPTTEVTPVIEAPADTTTTTGATAVSRP